jgi:hypothetical protein
MVEQDNVWLEQKKMSFLSDTIRRAPTRTRKIKHDNFDAFISVVYEVNSEKVEQFAI